ELSRAQSVPWVWRAGGENEPVEVDGRAVGERYRTSLRVDCAHGLAEPDVDVEFRVGRFWLDEDCVCFELASEEALRERRPVVREGMLGGQHRQRGCAP